jgi:GntR family transcriptional regulator
MKNIDKYIKYINEINRKSPIPFYVQLKEALHKYIDVNDLKPGDQLPGEMTICTMYDVSRTVVRQALQEMEHEGVIVKEKGRGAFIAQTKITESLVQKLTGFHQDMVSRGFKPVSKVLDQQVQPAGSKIASMLGLEADSQIIKITRLRHINDEPITLVTTYLPYDRCKGIEKVDLTHQSLYALLEKEYGIIITNGKRTIQAIAADEHEAKSLNQEIGAPLISLDSISYLSGGTPIEYYHAVHRGDRSQFTVELVKFQSQGGMRTSISDDLKNIPPSHGEHSENG